jgi:plasmid maintenance system antidote protein VapI
VRIGEKIALRIQELGTNNRRVALAADLSPSFLGAVIKGEKTLGLESAKKLAPALNWPLSELIGTDPARVERWFWSAAIGGLPEAQLDELKQALPIRRAAWSLRQVRSKYPDLDLAALVETSPEHVERIIDEQGAINGQLAMQITESLELPPHWITLGEPGPSEELAQRVLQHRNAAAWLALVDRAMQQDIPPAKIARMLDAFLELVDPEK